MAMDISGLKKSGEDVKRQLDASVEKIAEIGHENEEVKSRIAEIPSDLDNDLQELIGRIPDTVKGEAASDINAIRSSEMEKAEEEVRSIRETAEKKISDNAAARSKMDSISGRYGKSEISQAGSRLERNSEDYRGLQTDVEGHLQESINKFNDTLANL